MKKLTQGLLLTLLGGVLGACATPTPPSVSLEGEVFYLQRIALPDNATLTVNLQDVSLADAPAVLLARQSGPVKGQVPLAFHLEYDPAQVKPGHRYALSARIELAGKLLFITTEQHGVELNGQPTPPLRLRLDPAN